MLSRALLAHWPRALRSVRPSISAFASSFHQNSLQIQKSYSSRVIDAGKRLQPPEWKSFELTAVQKDFYRPHEKTINRPDDEVAAYRHENRIIVSDGAPKPILSFEELNVGDFVNRKLHQLKFKVVTPVQAQGWPIALSGTNMVGIAQTG